MRLRKLLLVAVLLCGLFIAGAAIYLWRTVARPDLVTQQASRAVHDVSSSKSSDEFVEKGRRWLGKLKRQMQREPYPLDDRSRIAVQVPKRGLHCPDVELETYRGDTLGYSRPVKINPHFKTPLKRFEKIAAQVGREVYGRPPSRIIHFGTYNCRTLRAKKLILSEHAFGNAIDVAGFKFETASAKAREQLGRAGESFEVSVLHHWEAEQGFERKHSVFLKRLAQELDNDRVFRGMLVPPAPGHHDHFHLDMGWWSYMNGDPSLDASDST